MMNSLVRVFGRMGRLSSGGVLLLAALLWTQPAAAQADSCAFRAASATLVDFSVYSGGLLPADSTGVIPLTCTPAIALGTVAYTVSISTGSSGGFSPRTLLRMGGGGALNYDIYIDPTRLIVWGDGSLGTGTVSGLCSGDCDVLAYGRIPGAQVVPSGSYADDVLITVDF